MRANGRDMDGIIAESRGPGANSPAGNGKRVVVGRSPVATHDGSKYVTWNHKDSESRTARPKTAIELTATGERTAILIHPKHRFLASIGFLNSRTSLPNERKPITYASSRRRIIVMIETMKSFQSAAFPNRNNREIPRAFIVSVGEPTLP